MKWKNVDIPEKVISQGHTKEEAIVNIKEAIKGYIAALEDDGLSVPPEHFDTILVAV